MSQSLPGLFTVRSIVPNVTNAFLLRVYVDAIDQRVIVAWQITWERYGGAGRLGGQAAEDVSVRPILAAGDFEAFDNAVDFICDHHRYLLDDEEFETREEAVTYARTLLVSRSRA